jgi:pimeloyl-ACP methyl ester carboxylesterase
MPFVSNRGQRIHYSVDGSGPLIVLQHGLLMDAASWAGSGLVAALAERFCVACIDSLGHGLSDKPSDPELYAQRQRAGDIVAVIDALGYRRAHLLGYSMGGWIAVAVARYHPDRISTLVIGGWDPVNGLPAGPGGPVTFDPFMILARRAAPELTGWVTPDIKPAVRACFEALSQLDGACETIKAATFPVLFWQGQNDTGHDRMQAFAAANGFAFLSSTGDHIAAVLKPEPDAIQRIRSFFERAAAASPSTDKIT